MKKRKFISMITILTLSLMLISCGNAKKDEAVADNSVSNQDTKNQTTTKQDASLTTEEKVANLISEMSLEEKAGQMLQAARDQLQGSEITNLGLGSVLSGGGSCPGNNEVDDWTTMMDTFQNAALKSKHQIPMIYGVDAVHGLSLVKGAVVFPHNIGLGAANDADLMYKMGEAVAEEMKLAKIPWNFSPCVAVCQDPRWGRTYESYSSDPAIVTALAEAYIKGQSDHGVVPTVKHYVADGGTSYGTGEKNKLLDRGDVKISEEELRKTHLAPYKELVKSGVKVVMASFSSYQGVKMHENKYLLTDVLKNEFGFKGFVVTDWEGISGLSGSSYEENVALAINAGVDMLMEPFSYKDAINAIVENVKNGVIDQKRIDDAVSRILTVKYDMGLFDDPNMEKVKHDVTELGSDGYRYIAKQLVEKSLVLLKNDNRTLPLKKGQKIFVTGPALNDLGLQCGGWGLTWQGVTDEKTGKINEGTTILEGLETYAKVNGFTIITDKKHAKEADVVILAVGEMPYAEYEGDTKDLSIIGEKGHPDNKEAIKYVSTLNKPVVSLIVAGRNVLINDYIKDWDSVVMCYLPGTEGDGIASVLTGETPFTGKLAMPYYKDVDDIDKDNAELLFDFGYGLTY
ncbi:glycoside hydrolase family 3 protein [Anaeromicropila herbilytica]|uniref:beta-glucosidase n=1 Tax=Anaeromicropila herbilytica TaxID=2785025 RepID=A0A7R7EMW3_9FIRM|nr:glycoside hydrolase family 3 protein [Anaeromicropila herbilytica]BCN31770.1 beta-glucosidase [Anaeromicropila herbilytica]